MLRFVGNFIVTEMENIKPFEEDDPALPAAVPTSAAPAEPIPQPACDDVLSFSVPNWLKGLGYDMYIQKFMDQGFDNLLAVQALDEIDLDAIGVTLPGHRKTLIVASERLRAATSPSAIVCAVNTPVATPAPRPASTNPSATSVTSNRTAPVSPTGRPTAALPTPAAAPTEFAEAQQPATPAVRRPATLPSIITIDKGEIPIVTNSFIDRNTSDDAVLQKGVLRYLEGKLRSVVLKGAEVLAEIRSKRPDTPHKVSLHTKMDTSSKKCAVTKAMCTCVTKPDTGFCKHIVCVLVFLNQQHPSLKESPSRLNLEPFEQMLVMGSNGSWVPAGTNAASSEQIKVAAPSAPKKKQRKSDSAVTTPGAEPSAKKPRVYVPKHRSCAWAIMMALHQVQFSMNPSGLTKEELIAAASPYSDTPFLPRANAPESYSGWSAMTTLQDKGLVIRSGRPHRFKLSTTGLDLAERLVASLPAQNKMTDEPSQPLEMETINDSNGAAFDIPQPQPRTASLKSAATIPRLITRQGSADQPLTVGDEIFSGEQHDDTDVDEPASADNLEAAPADDRPLEHFDCDVVLLVDNREIKNNRGLKKKLADRGVMTESRTLDLGDIAWIARGRTAGSDHEYMLDCIIERKRVSDLEMSIEDNRFLEQKFRLQKCGLKVLYLVEGKLERTHPNYEALENAMIQTLVQSGFTVHRTQNEDETLSLLSSITKSFIQTLRGDEVERCRSVMKRITYAEFSAAGSKSKNLNVRDLWSMQLLQIRGCTIEKAKVLVDRYPTPRHLLQAYERLRTDLAREELLKDLSLDAAGVRKIGKPLSRDVYLLYHAPSYRSETEKQSTISISVFVDLNFPRTFQTVDLSCRAMLVHYSRIPADVLEHHLVPYLSPADRIAFSLVCADLAKLLRKHLEKDRVKKQQKAFASLFSAGHLHAIIWFQQALKYPKNRSADFRNGLYDAAAGRHLSILQYAHQNGEDFKFDSKSRLTVAAARAGDLPLLQWLISVADLAPTVKTSQAAAEQGHLHILKYAKENSFPWNDWVCAGAALGGHLDVLKWLRANGAEWSHFSCSMAAQRGHLDVLKWLHDQGCPWDHYACHLAAGMGHFQVLRYLMQSGCQWNSLIVPAVLESDDLELKKLLVTTSGRSNTPAFHVEEHLFKIAQSPQNLPFIEWLRFESGLSFELEDICIGAATRGNFEIMLWLKEQKYSFESALAMKTACEHGNLTVIKFLRENGGPFDVILAAAAAYGGHFDVLKWLHESGCPWDEGACAFAAQNARLEILTWLHSNGCPITVRTLRNAVRSGKLEIVKWVRELPGVEWDASVCDAAAMFSNLEILKWLRANGCPWDTSIYEHLKKNPDMLRWVVENGGPLTSATCRAAASVGDLDLLKSLRAKGCEWDKQTCVDAVDHSRLSVLKWAIENGCPYEKSALQIFSFGKPKLQAYVNTLPDPPGAVPGGNAFVFHTPGSNTGWTAFQKFG